MTDKTKTPATLRAGRRYLGSGLLQGFLWGGIYGIVAVVFAFTLLPVLEGAAPEPGGGILGLFTFLGLAVVWGVLLGSILGGALASVVLVYLGLLRLLSRRMLLASWQVVIPAGVVVSTGSFLALHAMLDGGYSSERTLGILTLAIGAGVLGVWRVHKTLGLPTQNSAAHTTRPSTR